MDRLVETRALIKEAIETSPHYVHRPQDGAMETVCIFDELHDHYILMRTGWEDGKHVRYIILHIRIKNDRIWIEEDWTEDGITDALLRAGVPKEDIVLGFQSPSMRHYTDFAIA